MRIQAIKIYFITMFMVVFGFTLVFAGNTGKISGRVTDAQSGQPLPGCNILVEGTYYGAATDVDGNYFILNIPPGTYTLRFMMIGYGQLRITDIKVKVDFTTDVDASMTVEALQAGEVTVVAERPMIQKDLTSSASVVGSEEMESLPVTEVGDV